MTGIPLAELLRRPARNSYPTTFSILWQAAALLDEAHAHGHLHPALSPASLVVEPVADQRLVRVEILDLHGPPRPSLHTVSSRQPAPEHAKYMSREEILGMTRDARSDVFSLAVIAYESLTGQKPFDAPDLPGLCYAICVEEPRHADTIVPEVGREAAQVLDRGLAKEPSARFKTCTEFVEALASAMAPHLEGSAVDAPLEAVHAPVKEVVPEPVVAAPLAEPAVNAAFSAVASGTATESRGPASTLTATTRPTVAAPPPEVPSQEAPSVTPPSVKWTPLPDRNARRTPEAAPPYGDSRSLLQRFGWIALLALLLVGGLVWVIIWRPKPDLPTQVVDTNAGPATPPPASSSAPTSGPSPAPGSSSSTATATATNPPARPISPPPTTQTASRDATVPPNHAAEPVPAARQSTRPKPSVLNPASTPADLAKPNPDGSAFVEMLSQPPGARIVIDNRPTVTCVTPCSLELSAGRHVLTAQLDGFAANNRIFRVPEERNLVLTMEQSIGTVLVTSNPAGATILVDGKEAGRAPLTLHLKSGQHRLDAMYGAAAQQKILDVQSDAIQGANFDLP